MIDTRSTRNERMNADFNYSLNQRETLSFTIINRLPAWFSSVESVNPISPFLLFIRVRPSSPRRPRIHPSPVFHFSLFTFHS